MKFGNQVSESEISDNEYLLSLEELLLDVDIGGLLEILEEMGAWLEYRNEIIHSSMNKNIESLYDDLDVQVEKGMEYARYIDTYDSIRGVFIEGGEVYPGTNSKFV